MFKMGGLRKELPLTFWTFLIGAASLSALPLVTAGFYSKDLILWAAYSSDKGSTALWAAGLIGALLTALYTFRMVFLAFFGEAKPLVVENRPLAQPGYRIRIPLVVLAALSLVGGFVELPDTLGRLPLFSDFVQTVLPPMGFARGGPGTELALQIVAAVVSLGGIFLAYLFFLRRPQTAESLARTSWGAALHRFWFVGWGFDWVYDRLLVRPFVWLAQADRDDVADLIYDGLAALSRMLNHILSATETGKVRWYAAGIAVGAIITIAIAVSL
jgi:NADH-quinone oxidoreductase subunit L